METIIRQETADDYAEVHQLLISAFEKEDEAKLVDALRNDSSFVPALSLVAVANEKVVGYILFTKIKIKNGQSTFESLALAPVAVDPLYQHEGIGSKLIEGGHELARSIGNNSVIVLGHENYYPRFGYRPASRWNINCPFPVPENVFMAKELIQGSLEIVNGTVEYSPPFSML